MNPGTVYCKASLMRECRTGMPGLNLISEDYLDLAFVSSTDFDPWLQDVIDG
jgi:hypothetical protein